MARSLLKEPKIYFLDNGLVRGDAGARLENAVAAMLLKHCHYRQDAEGKAVTLHTIRDKERHEIDFVLAEGDTVTDLIEVKLGDAVPTAYLHRMADRFAPARAAPRSRIAAAGAAWPGGSRKPGRLAGRSGRLRRRPR